jgi:hypothetical protein
MRPDNDPSDPPRKPRMLLGIAIAALVVAFVVLHLTGVLGPGSH